MGKTRGKHLALIFQWPRLDHEKQSLCTVDFGEINMKVKRGSVRYHAFIRKNLYNIQQHNLHY